MTVTFMAGFETRAALSEGITLNGTSAISQVQARTGTSSVRCNPASGASGSISITTATNSVQHFGLFIATLPSITRLIAGATAAASLRLTSTGQIGAYDASTQIGTTTTTFVTGQWYWISFRFSTTFGTTLAVNGAVEITGASSFENGGTLGFTGTEPSAADIYIDDVIVDSGSFLGPSKVAQLLPTADSARSAGWVGGAGGTTSLFDAVNNNPPVGVADTGTNTSQIRNATAEANGSYDATMTTYSAAGLVSSDTVVAVQAGTVTAAPVVTSAKQGTVGVVSNPTIANVALAAGGTAGAFWSGVAGGTFPTGWKTSFGTVSSLPSVTLGTAPVMRITQVTSSTRIADVCAMWMYVAYTPAGVQVPYANRMPPLLAQ